MDERQQAVLRLQPHMVPDLRAAFSAALVNSDTRWATFVEAASSRPWLGDEISSEVAAHYTRRAMEQPDSSYRALQQYEAELACVHDTLQRMEDQYLHTDQATADRLRRT